METIESLVAELNELFKRYINEKEDFKELERMREVVLGIKNLGYSIVNPILEFTEPEYDLLSDSGKKDYSTMVDIRRMKMEAVQKHEFERAADLRDDERKLLEKIKIDFANQTQNQHIILAGKFSDLILFNDPENVLIALFKK